MKRRETEEGAERGNDSDTALPNHYFQTALPMWANHHVILTRVHTRTSTTDTNLARLLYAYEAHLAVAKAHVTEHAQKTHSGFPCGRENMYLFVGLRETAPWCYSQL